MPGHTHIHTHTHTHTHTHSSSTCTRTHIHTHTHTTCMHAYSHTCTHIHVHARTHARTHAHTHTHLLVLLHSDYKCQLNKYLPWLEISFVSLQVSNSQVVCSMGMALICCLSVVHIKQTSTRLHDHMCLDNKTRLCPFSVDISCFIIFAALLLLLL